MLVNNTGSLTRVESLLSIAGPDGCEGCQNARQEFQKLWDSPAREGKPGEKWYYDDRHLITSDCTEYHRGYGWCIEGQPKTYVFPYTERQFQELVEKGKLGKVSKAVLSKPVMVFSIPLET